MLLLLTPSPPPGDTMSVTSGVVSRIEVTSYVHGAAELLGGWVGLLSIWLLQTRWTQCRGQS